MTYKHILILLAVPCLWLLSGCSAIGEYIAPPNVSAAKTAAAQAGLTQTPVFKITPSKFRMINSPACLQAEFAAIQTSSPAYDQMLWSRTGQSLVYIAPSQATNWYTGDLVMITAPKWKEPTLLASNAAGSLAWSLGGDALAFASLRVEEGVYTVSTVNLQSHQVTDLFPGNAAKEDIWSSPKYVQRWSDNGLIDVLTSCGVDCRRVLSVSSSGSVVQTQDLKGNDVLSISTLPNTHVVDISQEKDNYPAIMAHPNWSPDGKQVVFSDTQGIVWVYSPATLSQYILDSENGPFEETRWSADGSYLALRNRGVIYIYGFRCK
jgi:hypothetical protein